MLSFDRGSSRLLDWKDTRPHKLRLAMTLAVIGSRIPEEMKHQPFQLWLKPNSVHCLQGFMDKYNQAYQNIHYLMTCTFSENKLNDFRDFRFTAVYNSILFSSPLVLIVTTK